MEGISCNFIYVLNAMHPMIDSTPSCWYSFPHRTPEKEHGSAIAELRALNQLANGVYRESRLQSLVLLSSTHLSPSTQDGGEGRPPDFVITHRPLESEIPTHADPIQGSRKVPRPEMRFVLMHFCSSMVELRGMSVVAPRKDEILGAQEKGFVAEQEIFARVFVYKCCDGRPSCEAKRSANLCK